MGLLGGGGQHTRRSPLPTGLSRPLTWRTDTIIFSKLNREETTTLLTTLSYFENLVCNEEVSDS